MFVRRAFKRQCTEDGSWLEGACEPVTCDPPPAIFHGMYQCTDGFRFDSTCWINCPRANHTVRPLHTAPCKQVCLSLLRRSTVCLCLLGFLSMGLAFYLSVYLSICLSLGLFDFLCFGLTVWLWVCLFVCLSVCLSVGLSICLWGRVLCMSAELSICLSVCLWNCLSVCVYVYVCLCLSICYLVGWLACCLSVCLSVHLSVCQLFACICCLCEV